MTKDKHVIIQNNKNINIVLIRHYSSNNLSNAPKYSFKLCSRTIVVLQKLCKGTVYFKINDCFKFKGHIFELLKDNKIEFKYKNMDYCSELIKEDLRQGDQGYQLIKINTNEQQIENDIYFHTICIPVKPNCIPNNLIGKHACLTDIGEFVVDPCDDKQNKCKSIKI